MSFWWIPFAGWVIRRNLITTTIDTLTNTVFPLKKWSLYLFFILKFRLRQLLTKCVSLWPFQTLSLKVGYEKLFQQQQQSYTLISTIILYWTTLNFRVTTTTTRRTTISASHQMSQHQNCQTTRTTKAWENQFFMTVFSHFYFFLFWIS